MSAVESTVSAWADRIRPHLDQAAQHIIAAGRELNEAKAALPHGQFGPLLEELGIGERMAQRFMRVARHPVISNPSRVTGLPASISTLDALTRVSDETLTNAIDSGQVHSGMTRDEAQALDAREVTDQLRDAFDNVERIAQELNDKYERAQQVADELAAATPLDHDAVVQAIETANAYAAAAADTRERIAETRWKLAERELAVVLARESYDAGRYDEADAFLTLAQPSDWRKSDNQPGGE